MYLAKFFHRPPGDDDRELLLIPGGDPMVMGIYMDEGRDEQRDDFLREEFSDTATAVAVFHRHAAELAAAGYVETAHTRYTLRNLLPDPQPKPDWQKGLDELMLAALSAPLEEQARHLAALRGTPAEHEPLYLWLAAHHGYAADGDNAQTIQFAEQGRDAIVARRAAKTPHYAWSIAESELEAHTLEVLSWAHLRADDPQRALQAIEAAAKVAANPDRRAQLATILYEHFPARQEEAFDAAYRWHKYADYEEIIALPAYAEYVTRRKKSKSDKGWRWSAKKPASDDDLARAEAELGAKLPEDYRKFLATHGQVELRVRLPEHSGELCFYQPSELATQRNNVFDFISRTEGGDPDEADAYFRQEYGVAARDLVPVAQPAQYSRCVVINIGEGERFGWCFHWDHEGAWELEQATPNFDAALKTLTQGIERRDTATLEFLGIYLD